MNDPFFPHGYQRLFSGRDRDRETLERRRTLFDPDLPAELTPANAFETLIWDNREVCNHCFHRLRAVTDYDAEALTAWRRSRKRYLREKQDSRAVDHGSIGYDSYRTAMAWSNEAGEYILGTGQIEARVSCEQCGWIGQRHESADYSIDRLQSLLPALIESITLQARRYRCPEAPHGYLLAIDPAELETIVCSLKSSDSGPEHADEIFSRAIDRHAVISPIAP